MKTQLRWKFLLEGMRSYYGNCDWETGKWKTTTKPLVLCEWGFHCSEKPSDALRNVYGEILAKVEVRGKSIVEDDKTEVWSSMRVVDAYRWEKKDFVELAIFAAELCLPSLFEKPYTDQASAREAIQAAKNWVLAPTKENEEKARQAFDATYALDAAAYTVVCAYAVVSVYAVSAAAYATYAVSYAISWDESNEEKINDWMEKRTQTLKKI